MCSILISQNFWLILILQSFCNIWILLTTTRTLWKCFFVYLCFIFLNKFIKPSSWMDVYLVDKHTLFDWPCSSHRGSSNLGSKPSQVGGDLLWYRPDPRYMVDRIDYCFYPGTAGRYRQDKAWPSQSLAHSNVLKHNITNEWSFQKLYHHSKTSWHSGDWKCTLTMLKTNWKINVYFDKSDRLTQHCTFRTCFTGSQWRGSFNLRVRSAGTRGHSGSAFNTVVTTATQTRLTVGIRRARGTVTVKHIVK